MQGLKPSTGEIPTKITSQCTPISEQFLLSVEQGEMIRGILDEGTLRKRRYDLFTGARWN